MAKIEIKNIYKSFPGTKGKQLDVLVNVNLQIESGEFLCSAQAVAARQH